MFLFHTAWKHQKNLRGFRNETLVENGLNNSYIAKMKQSFSYQPKYTIIFTVFITNQKQIQDYREQLFLSR